MLALRFASPLPPPPPLPPQLMPRRTKMKIWKMTEVCGTATLPSTAWR